MNLLFSPSSLPNGICQREVHLWLVDVKRVVQSTSLSHYSQYFTEEESHRLAAFSSTSKKEIFTVTRGVLRTLISKYTACPPSSVTFTYNAHGKPSLTENPEQIEFNLSHSGHYILIGITKNRRVGVDIERVNLSRNIRHIGEFYYHPEEWNDKYLSELSQKNTDVAAYFYQLWTLKEAFIKAEGKGMAISPAHYFFKKVESSHPELVVDSSATTAFSEWQFEHLFIKDYSVALAYENIMGDAADVTVKRKQFVV